MKTGSQSQKPDYGLDAPRDLRRFALAGAGGIVIGLVLILVPKPGLLAAFNFIGPALVFIGVLFLAIAGVMVWGSRVGKFRLRDRLIASIPWRGDERVLDIGCGRGLLLIAAAKHLTSGRAVGVDIWAQSGQARSKPEAALKNARLEEVEDRVEIRSGDARQLTLPDQSFDVVISSWVIHNIESKEGRDRAIREIIRVLKPGGRVAILDIEHAAEYAELFRQGGLREVKLSNPNYLFIAPTYLVSAYKPTQTGD